MEQLREYCFADYRKEALRFLLSLRKPDDEEGWQEVVSEGDRIVVRSQSTSDSLLFNKDHWKEMFEQMFIMGMPDMLHREHADDMLFFVRKEASKDKVFVRRKGKAMPEDLAEGGSSAHTVDWYKSTLLNMVLQTPYHLTVSSCRYEQLPSVLQDNCTAPGLMQVTKKVFASPTKVHMNLDSSRTECAQPVVTYPHICFAVDNFDDAFRSVVLNGPDECYAVCLWAHRLTDADSDAKGPSSTESAHAGEAQRMSTSDTTHEPPAAETPYTCATSSEPLTDATPPCNPHPDPHPEADDATPTKASVFSHTSVTHDMAGLSISGRGGGGVGHPTTEVGVGDKETQGLELREGAGGRGKVAEDGQDSTTGGSSSSSVEAVSRTSAVAEHPLMEHNGGATTHKPLQRPWDVPSEASKAIELQEKANQQSHVDNQAADPLTSHPLQSGGSTILLFSGYVSFQQLDVVMGGQSGNALTRLISGSDNTQRVMMRGPGGLGHADVAVTVCPHGDTSQVDNGELLPGQVPKRKNSFLSSAFNFAKSTASVAKELTRPAASDASGPQPVRCALMTLALPVHHIAQQVLQGS